MRVLVTGATGFLGGVLCRGASSRGHAVTALSRRGGGGVVGVDLRRDDLSPVLADAQPDVILHAAGASSVGASTTAPLADFEAAVLTWVRLVEAVRASGARPLVVLLSSAAVYGNPPRLPVDESTTPAPISPYGFHKLICETVAREFAACFGLRFVVARIFSVIGPSQRRLLAHEIYAQLASGGDVSLQGTGDETRDFLDEDDVASAVLGLSERLVAMPPGVEIFNVASGAETSVRSLAELLRASVGSQAAIHARGIERPGDPRRWRADTTRLCNALHTFSPRPLEQTLARCVASWSLPA